MMIYDTVVGNNGVSPQVSDPPALQYGGDDFKGLLTTDYEVVHLCRVHTCCHLRISAGVYGQKQMRCHTY